jgi:guanylate kinase
MLFVISGPSGVGKGTLISTVLHKNSMLCLSVSATTRPPRSNEIHGQDYYFLSENEFDNHVTSDNFLEWCHVHHHRYGTLKSDVSQKLMTFRAIIIEIDVQGAQKIKRNSAQPQCHIFIDAPSEAVLEQRLRHRNTENNDAIIRRLNQSKQERLFKKNYDIVIVNNELTQSINELNNVILKRLTKGVC